jgi:hypothetical protein
VSFGVARAQSLTAARTASTGCSTHAAAVVCTLRLRMPALRP